MTPTIVSGARGTANASRTRLDMAQKVLELEPTSTPLLVLTKRADSRSCHNSKFLWQEDQLLARFDRINNGAGYSSSATSLVVDNGAYFAQDDLVYVTRTGEVMRVQSVSTNTLTVVRGIGSGNAALVDNDELYIISTSAPEGDTSRAARSQNPAEVTNYCQIIRTSVEETETALHTDFESDPHDWERQQNHAGIEHAKKIELMLWFGRPSEDTSGSQPRRTSGGFFYFCNQNTTDAGGNFTNAEFEASLRPVFRYSGNRTKFAAAAALPVSVLNGFATSKLSLIQADNDKTFGLSIFRYVSPHGVLNVATHWLFEGDVYANVIAYVDLENASYRYLKNKRGSRDTHIKRNIQEPDRETEKDEWSTECGGEFGLPLTHGRVINITS